MKTAISLNCYNTSNIDTDIYFTQRSKWFEFTIDDQEITLFFPTQEKLEKFITSIEETIFAYRLKEPAVA
jgi:hypothetical protein